MRDRNLTLNRAIKRGMNEAGLNVSSTLLSSDKAALFSIITLPQLSTSLYIITLSTELSRDQKDLFLWFEVIAPVRYVFENGK